MIGNLFVKIHDFPKIWDFLCRTLEIYKKRTINEVLGHIKLLKTLLFSQKKIVWAIWRGTPFT